MENNTTVNLKAADLPVERTAPVVMAGDSVQVPNFKTSVIQKYRKDGYWAETFHFDSEDFVPGVIV
jgi:hypothetical protein